MSKSFGKVLSSVMFVFRVLLFGWGDKIICLIDGVFWL